MHNGTKCVDIYESDLSGIPKCLMIVVGDPGAGKTTTVSMFILYVALVCHSLNRYCTVILGNMQKLLLHPG